MSSIKNGIVIALVLTSLFPFGSALAQNIADQVEDEIVVNVPVAVAPNDIVTVNHVHFGLFGGREDFSISEVKVLIDNVDVTNRIIFTAGSVLPDQYGDNKSTIVSIDLNESIVSGVSGEMKNFTVKVKLQKSSNVKVGSVHVEISTVIQQSEPSAIIVAPSKNVITSLWSVIRQLVGMIMSSPSLHRDNFRPRPGVSV